MYVTGDPYSNAVLAGDPFLEDIRLRHMLGQGRRMVSAGLQRDNGSGPEVYFVQYRDWARGGQTYTTPWLNAHRLRWLFRRLDCDPQLNTMTRGIAEEDMRKTGIEPPAYPQPKPKATIGTVEVTISGLDRLERAIERLEAVLNALRGL